VGASILICHQELCRLIDVKTDTWLKRVSRGQAPLPHSTQGRTHYYRRADLRHYIKTGRWPARMRFKGHPPAPEP
jgi:hypothetical protein